MNSPRGLLVGASASGNSGSCRSPTQEVQIRAAGRLAKARKKLPERDALQMTFNAMDRGAAGVDMGRNIFQSDSPLGMIKAVNAVVHEDASVDEAYALHVDEKSASGSNAGAGVSADDSRKI
jgi:hypothetical protein